MARRVDGIGAAEYHAPRGIGGRAPQLAIEKIGQPSQELSRGLYHRDIIQKAHRAELVGPGEQKYRDQNTQRTTMIGHAALPDFDQFDRMADIKIDVAIEKDVTQASAHHDAQKCPEEQVAE